MSAAHDVLSRLVSGQAPSFAVVRRRDERPDTVSILIGDPHRLDTLAELGALANRHRSGPTPNPTSVVAALPYRQLRERGFECIDDHSPIVALAVHEEHELTVEDFVDQTMTWQPPVATGAFEDTDADYSARVERILSEEIDRGEGANFVLHRTFRGELDRVDPTSLLALVARLLVGEPGAYWTYAVVTPELVLLGASPELHARLKDGVFSMNPISGTLRHGRTAPTYGELVEFLADDKERSELSMVLDEELKIVAALCESDIRVEGPRLRQMSTLTHTEYLLHGRTGADPVTVLRETMFAPTVTGSPVENAARVIARHEDHGRGYYSGALVMLGTDEDGRDQLDSAILIRTMEADPESLEMTVRVGCTIVRRSSAVDEAAETRSKARGLLRALGLEPGEALSAPALRAADAASAAFETPEVHIALAARNVDLASYWVNGESDLRSALPHTSRLVGLRVLVLDAEDRFTAMLMSILRALGMQPETRSAADAGDLTAYDLVVAGPGPGNPLDVDDVRVAGLSTAMADCLRTGIPLLAICLSHQILADRLGLAVRRRPRGNQGVQVDIDLFGDLHRVGFYNSYAAYVDEVSSAGASADRVVTPYGLVEVATWGQGGEVAALRGSRFASVQFHPECVLTIDGPRIVHDLVDGLVRVPTSTGIAGQRSRQVGMATTDELPGSHALRRINEHLLDREHGGLHSVTGADHGVGNGVKTLIDQAVGTIALAQFGTTSDVETAAAGLDALSRRDGHAGFLAVASRSWGTVAPVRRSTQEQLLGGTALLVSAHRTGDLAAQVRAVDVINRCLALSRSGALPDTVRPDWAVKASARASGGAVAAGIHAVAWAHALDEPGVTRTVLPDLARRLVRWARNPNVEQWSFVRRARMSLALLHAARLLGDEDLRDLALDLVGPERHGQLDEVSLTEVALLHTVSLLSGHEPRGRGAGRTRERLAEQRTVTPATTHTRTRDEAALLRALGHELVATSLVGGDRGARM